MPTLSDRGVDGGLEAGSERGDVVRGEHVAALAGDRDGGHARGGGPFVHPVPVRGVVVVAAPRPNPNFVHVVLDFEVAEA